jgi:hypothetical protein
MRRVWRRYRLKIAVAAVATFVVGWSLYWSTRVYTDTRPAAEDAVRRKLEAALPPKASRDNVKIWLAAEGFSSSDIFDGGDRLVGIQAGKRLSSDNWLGFYDFLDLYFYFNADGKLERQDVRIISTGT